MEMVLRYKYNHKEFIVYRENGKFYGCINNEETIGYNTPYATVTDDIDIYDYYSKQEHMNKIR